MAEEMPKKKCKWKLQGLHAFIAVRAMLMIESLFSGKVAKFLKRFKNLRKTYGILKNSIIAIL